jgi:WD40 repeat protein
MAESPHVTPVFVDADELVAFLESLRAAGYRIGTEKYIAAHDIALALSAEPRETRTAERLCSLLRPLLCSTADEQEEFVHRFRPWADRIVPGRQRTISPQPVPTPEPTPVTPREPIAPLAESLAYMKRLSASFWAVVAIVGVVVAYAVWASMRTPEFASVHIQSDPEGAVVRVITDEIDSAQADAQGDSLGRTGMQWNNVLPDRYTLHFHLAGYRDTSQIVTASGDSVHHVNVALTRTPRGTVVLTSNPPGATVRLEPLTREHGSELIDTVRIGTAPVEWSDLSVGEYRVIMVLDGYDATAESLVVDPVQPVARDITLERTRLGTVRIDVEPGGAEVQLGGEVAGTTPIVLERPIGNYTITLRAPEHRDSTLSITIQEAESVNILVSLTRKKTGRLAVRTDPGGARVLVDEVEQPTGDTESIELLEGNYKVRAELQGYEPFVTDAEVVPDSTTEVTTVLTLLQPPRYRVAFHPESAMIVTGDPGIAVVTWNGMTTPERVVPASGLRVRRGGYREASRPWSIVGVNAFPSDAGSGLYPRAGGLHDIVATSADARWIAVSSSGPFKDLFGGGLVGDSVIEIRIFDGLGRLPFDRVGLDGGGGVLAMRFNAAGDSLHVVTRNGKLITVARTPCAINETCVADAGWEQAGPIDVLSGRVQNNVQSPLRAGTFENDSVVALVDSEGYLSHYDRSLQVAWKGQDTGIRGAHRLVSAAGVSTIVTVFDTAHVTEDPSNFRGFVNQYPSVTSVATSPDAEILITGTDSGGVYHRSGNTFPKEILPRRHRAAVTHVVLSPDGHAVASASQDGTLALWDLKREKWINSVWLDRLGVTSRDSAILGRQRWTRNPGVLSWSNFVSTDADAIQRPDYADGVDPNARATPRLSSASGAVGLTTQAVRLILSDRVTPASLTFSPDGNTIVVVTSDGIVRRWNVSLADRPDWRQNLLQNVAFSPDSSELVVPGAAGTVEVWDTWLREQRETLTGHRAHVTGVSYSPVGSYIATGDANGEVRLWARTPSIHRWLSAFYPGAPPQSSTAGTAKEGVAANGARQASSAASDDSMRAQAAPLAFSPDGVWLASRGDDNEVLIWDAQGGQLERTIALDSAVAIALAFSPDGRWLAAVDGAGGVRVVPIPTGESLPMLRASPANSIAWLSDSTFVTATANELRAFVLENGSVASDSTNAAPSVVGADWVLSATNWTVGGRPVVLSADGSTIATIAGPMPADPNEPARFDALRSSIREAGSERQFSQLEIIEPTTVTTFALSANGHWLAIADENRSIHILDKGSSEWTLLDGRDETAFPWAETGTLTLENPIDSIVRGDSWDTYGLGHEGRVQALAFSPDARVLVSAAADSTIIFWDLQRGERIGNPQYTGGGIRTLVFQPGGRMLASLGDDGTIRVWDLGIGIARQVHTREITSLSFSVDGRRLATASADSTIVVWDLWGYTAFDTVRANQVVESVAFSPDGQQLIAATADSVIHIWDASGSRVATIREWLSSGFNEVFDRMGITARDGSPVAGAILIALVMGAFALHRFLWRRRASRMLVRRQSEERPDIRHFALRNVDGYVFPRAPMIELSRRLRRRLEFVSANLDVPQTVTRTVRRGGVFTAAFMNRQERPEYVALVDRASIGDQHAAFVDDLLDRLVHDDVPIERYYFDGDMRVCFPHSRRERPMPLAKVAQKNAGRHLLIFSDSSALFDPVTNEPIAWVDLLRAWPERTLLTPEPRQHWTGREARLEGHFAVATATHTGLLSLTERSASPVAAESTTGRYPPMLRRRPRRWVERDRPEPAAVQQMITAVREYLDEAGFWWLCACAVYPEMNWRLTVNLGVLLQDDDGNPLVTADRLAALARLPWFRHDYMPDWLRTRLLDEMSEQREHQVRTAIEKLLVGAVEGRHDPHDLEIAKQQARTFHSLARSLLRVMRRNAKPGDPARDYVFQAFMSGRRTERLAVRLPRALNLLISRRQREAMPARLAADARRLQIAGLAGVPALALLVFGGTAAWRNLPEAMVHLGSPERFEGGRLIDTDSMLASQQDPSQQDVEPSASVIMGAVEDTIAIPAAASDSTAGSGRIDRANFFAAYRTVFGELDYAATVGLEQLLEFLENDPAMNDVRLRAYVLATVKFETGDRFVPVAEQGDAEHFQRYEPGTPIGDRLGNKVPGDGERFRGRGYIGITGRENYYRMSQVLGFEPKMTDLVDNPDKVNDPLVAYRIMSIGMLDGLFTGRKLSDFINERQTDYANASTVIGSGSSSSRAAAYAIDFEEILRESAADLRSATSS